MKIRHFYKKQNVACGECSSSWGCKGLLEPRGGDYFQMSRRKKGRVNLGRLLRRGGIELGLKDGICFWKYRWLDKDSRQREGMFEESPAFCYGSSTGERESEIGSLQKKVEMSFRVFISSSEAYTFVDKRKLVKNFE